MDYNGFLFFKKIDFIDHIIDYVVYIWHNNGL